MPSRLLSSVLLLLLLAAPASGLDYDEAALGDLSSSPDAPTGLVFDLGSNVVSGTLDGFGDIRDYMTFSLRDGEALSEIRQLLYVDATLPFLPGNRGYHAIIAGGTSLIPDTTNTTAFMGGQHLDQLPVGTDLLSILAGAPLVGTGFDVPLGPGTYTYHLQQTSPSPVRYEIEFLVIPEPGTALLLAGGLALLATRPSRRRIPAFRS